MNIEIKEDATYTFSFTKYANDLESNISSATISTETPGGTEILSSTSMSTSGATATYALDTSASTSYKVDRYYKAIMIIDGTTYIRLFDIVRFPFVNEVTISDLRKENRKALEVAGYKKDGEAESGTTTTAVDASFIGEDTYVGGEIEVFPTDNTARAEKASITAFDDTTGTFTFTPALDNAVTTNRFIVRRSFSEEITRAGDIVQSDLWKKEKRAYLILDNTQVNNMIVYKFFELLYAKKRTSISDEDRDHVQYMYYLDLYDKELSGLPLAYDANDDGDIDSDEEAFKDGIRLAR